MKKEMIRTRAKSIAAMMVAAMMLFAFAACGSGSTDTESTEPEDTTRQAETTAPTVGTDVDGRQIDDQSFYGTWVADSGKAMNMFDGFEITFNEDGTYDAVVTGEKISGTWTREGEKVTIVDDDGIIPANYTYTAKGGLKMYYEGEYVGFHR